MRTSKNGANIKSLWLFSVWDSPVLGGEALLTNNVIGLIPGSGLGARLQGYMTGRGISFTLLDRENPMGIRGCSLIIDASGNRELPTGFSGMEYLMVRDFASYQAAVQQLELYKAEPLPLRSHFPLFLPAAGKTVLVVGGGAVASRRIKTLCRFDWKVRVVSPEATGEVRALAEKGRISWVKRTFRSGDTEGAFLAVAATGCREVNRLVGEEARRNGAYVSVADSMEECGFYFPAIAENRFVVAGIAGNGTSHRETSKAAAKVRSALAGDNDERCRS